MDKYLVFAAGISVVSDVEDSDTFGYSLDIVDEDQLKSVISADANEVIMNDAEAFLDCDVYEPTSDEDKKELQDFIDGYDLTFSKIDLHAVDKTYFTRDFHFATLSRKYSDYDFLVIKYYIKLQQ